VPRQSCTLVNRYFHVRRKHFSCWRPPTPRMTIRRGSGALGHRGGMSSGWSGRPCLTRPHPPAAWPLQKKAVPCRGRGCQTPLTGYRLIQKRPYVARSRPFLPGESPFVHPYALFCPSRLRSRAGEAQHASCVRVSALDNGRLHYTRSPPSQSVAIHGFVSCMATLSPSRCATLRNGLLSLPPTVDNNCSCYYYNHRAWGMCFPVRALLITGKRGITGIYRGFQAHR